MLSFSTTDISLLLVAATVLAGLALALGILVGRAMALRARPAAAGLSDGVVAAIDQIERRVSVQTRAQGVAIEQFRSDLAALRGELYWLAGDQVLDQAIQMCRDGLPLDEIGTETGLPEDTLRALRLLRCH